MPAASYVIPPGVATTSDFLHTAGNAVFTIILFACLIKLAREKKDGKRRPFQNEIIGLCFAFSFAGTLVWGLNRLSSISNNAIPVLVPWTLSYFLYEVFLCVMFVCVLFCWLRIISVKFTPTHIVNRLVNRRKLAIIASIIWLIMCYIASVIGFLFTHDDHWLAIGLSCISLLPIIMTVGFLFVIRNILSLLRTIGNEYKGRRFKRKIYILGAAILLRLDVHLLYHFDLVFFSSVFYFFMIILFISIFIKRYRKY
eukprot:TRINITY_DN2736_c2_g2_i4.p1 TRINITY_DN2736_c2_g2~~TRINITY_DN2736_c2_g2_i4.p1  ORF type:complete len:255 (+),score=3.57 TRINITY_DN2736_c2_g2_i4:177-941(+)